MSYVDIVSSYRRVFITYCPSCLNHRYAARWLPKVVTSTSDSSEESVCLASPSPSPCSEPVRVGVVVAVNGLQILSTVRLPAIIIFQIFRFRLQDNIIL